ncbi:MULTISPECIES: class I adenylate-forming enzyme family protein [Rhodococcus]|uniref:class I adenylate-forming enzyme family protein n=1 Tax=Rhodococcus TaxID=1827 RepID=UPI00082B7985|nr:AMP-binding protein [Rhodococcus phenolicus]
MAAIDFFDRGWSMDPSKVAYRGVGEVWTYEQAGRLSCRIANRLLAEAGSGKATVAVLSPNLPTAWICVLGVWRADCTWVPLNPHNPVAENAELLVRFDVDLVMYHPDLAQTVEKIKKINGAVAPRMIAIGPGTSDPDLDEWTAAVPDTVPVVNHDPEAVVMLSPTGGTTGKPKGVMNTNRNIGVMVAHHLLALQYDRDGEAVNLAAAPMTHTAGMFSLQTTARGGTVVVVERATPELILPAIHEHRITELFLPPTVVYRLLEVLAHEDYDTSSLRYLMYAAAPMSLEKLKEGIRRLGPVFIECYGQMEAPAAISFLRPVEHMDGDRPAADDRLASCGRPYPLVEVQIKDPESGAPLGPGETGEICVTGDLLMKGYYKDPAKTAETIVDGWLHTGDLGHVDEQGYLYLTDRKKDLIISGGFNVYPGEVEQVVWGHPAVEDCAVVGAPDPDWGERVTAVVELKPGQKVTAGELRELCKQALGPVRAPKDFMFVDELPRSVNGKVLKKDLRETFWADSTQKI